MSIYGRLQMLAKLILVLGCKSEKQINTNMASVFQGMLMELLDTETGTWLHSQQRHPYSQYIYYEGQTVYWTISTLTETAYESILVPLLNDELRSMYCEYHQLEFDILEKKIIKEDSNTFLYDNYFKDYAKGFTIEFLTPTAFKSGGRYMNYPSVKWIFQSLMQKYDVNGQENQIFDEETLQKIEEDVVVTQYHLKSTTFHLEGMKIPSFKGKIQIYVKSNQSVVNLVNFLLRYGEYSGVGIKSAIGMGAIRVHSRERNGE